MLLEIWLLTMSPKIIIRVWLLFRSPNRITSLRSLVSPQMRMDCMQSSCRAGQIAARATQIGCLLSLAAGLVVLPARASEPGNSQNEGQIQPAWQLQILQSLPQQSRNDLLCQNNSDGASLPPPTRKPPVLTAASSDENGGGGERKKHRRGGDDSVTGSPGPSADNKRGDLKGADTEPARPGRRPPPDGQRPGGPPPGRRGGGFFAELDFSLLNLSDEQKEKIEQIRSENRPKMRDAHRRLGETF